MLLPFMYSSFDFNFIFRIPACPLGTYHCSNGKCVNNQFVCDGQNDCGEQINSIFFLNIYIYRKILIGDSSDELSCPDRCTFHLESSGDIIQSPNYPGKYRSFSDCKWVLEGSRGTNIILQVYYIYI